MNWFCFHCAAYNQRVFTTCWHCGKPKKVMK